MSEYITIDRREGLFAPEEKPGLIGRLVQTWARFVKLLAVIGLLWCAWKGTMDPYDGPTLKTLNMTRTSGPWGKPWVRQAEVIPNDR